MGTEAFIAGLKLWLIFFLAFFLMGYRDPASLFLAMLFGVVAGLAGRTISQALTIKNMPPMRSAPSGSQSAKNQKGLRFALEERARRVSELITQGRRRNSRSLKSKR